MDLQLDEQQELLRQSIDRYLEKELPFEIRSSQRTADDFLKFWRELNSSLGIAAAGAPEDAGGFGGGPEAEMIVAGSLGKALAVTPYVDAMVLTASLLLDIDRAETAEAVLSGETLAVTAIEEAQTRGDVALIETRAEESDGGWRLSGTKLAVPFAAQADIVIVPARLPDGGFALFELSGGALATGLKPLRLVDDTPAADILLDELDLTEATLIASGLSAQAALERAVDRARAALCSEAAGIASVMVADTIAYTKDREQFGVPLASFQALQHRMVDMWIAAEEISAAALLAALNVESPAAISAAKATMADNLRKIGQEAVQLHGAMGLTEELRVGHYFKRATVLEHRLGSGDRHVARYRATELAA